MKQHIIFTAALLLLPLLSFAQENGLSNRVTLSYELMNLDWMNEDDAASVAKGISAGYARMTQVGPRSGIFIEYGGKLAWLHRVKKGGYMGYTTYRSNFLNASLAVNAARPFYMRGKDFAISPFFGPNLKFNLIGKHKETWESKDGWHNRRTNYLSRDERYPAKIFQFGLNIGAGFTFRNLYASYTFQPDLSKYRDGGIYEGQFECTTNTNVFSVGYCF